MISPSRHVRLLTLFIPALLVSCTAGQNQIKTRAAQEPPPLAKPLKPHAAITEVDRAWGFGKSDLMPDPAVRYGVLDNGMRYAIRHNETPKDAASVRLLFDIGSVAEEDDQRGLAHFIEHMAFNGTTNVPEGEMVKILERYGLAFGADTNASTNFDQTEYLLELPTAEPALIDTALFLMRETASEITFDAEAIDRERGVILSEMRTRDNYRLRGAINSIEFLVPDTKLPNRFPIGTKDVLENAPAERFRAFYDTYYTPGRATLIVVGDIDVNSIEAQIKSKFSDWIAVNGEAPEPDWGSIDFDRKGVSNEFIDPAIEETVSFSSFAPYVKTKDTSTQRGKDLLKNIGYNIINRRIGRAIRNESAPFTGATINSRDFYEIGRQTSLRVSAKDGELEKGLAAAEKIIRTALTYGFTDAEVTEQVANYRTSIENFVKSANTRNSGSFANQIAGAAKSGDILTTPESSQERFELFAPAITAENVLAAVRADLGNLDNPLVNVTSKAGIEGGSEALRQIYLASRAEPVDPLQANTVSEFAYSDYGAPGTVKSDTRIDDLDIRTLTFENNVRLNIKKTDFEDDRVRVSLRIDGGELLDTAEKPNNTLLMNIYDSAGLKEHSIDDLLSLFAGRTVSFNFGAGNDYFGSYVATTPRDLEAQMQVLAAFVTAPGYREQALDRYRRSIPNFYARLYATPNSALSTEIGGILSDNDPRFTMRDRAVFETAEFETLRDTITERLQKGAIEIGIVGDVDEDATIAAVAQTFGALPTRETDFRGYENNRIRSFTKDRTTRRIYHTGKENQAILRLYWPTADDSDFKRSASLDILSRVLQLRLTDRLREELGATYSPGSSSFTSSLYPGYGYISFGSNVDYADIDDVYAVMIDIVEALNDAPPTEDEVERARKPVLERIRQSKRQNGRWMSIVDEAQSEPDSLERFRDAENVFAAITAEDIQQLAQLYLGNESALRVEAVHESKKP